MGRLIDADKLWKDIARRMDYCDDILEIIKKQLTVEVERKTGDWIPVSERLPEKKHADYICTARWSEDEPWEVMELEWGKIAPNANACDVNPDNIKGRSYDGWGFGERWFNGIDNVEQVIAWMPLPESYREKEGEPK